jgi:hypothetical protein
MVMTMAATAPRPKKVEVASSNMNETLAEVLDSLALTVPAPLFQKR